LKRDARNEEHDADAEIWAHSPTIEQRWERGTRGRS
jgi:hypothetical protein